MVRFLKYVGLILTTAAFAGVLVLMLWSVGLGFGSLLVLLVLGAVYTWMLFAFVHYRACRQEELLQVLAAAAEAQAPLAPALLAYVHDRPHGGLRELWVGLILFFIVPGYYWIWYSNSNYDRKVERLARLLEEGHSLPEALALTPGVTSRETRLAVALGQDTGQLGACLKALRNPARARLATLWLELVPRFTYPLFLLLVINGVLTFWLLYLTPRFQRLFAEFKTALPVETQRAMDLGHFALAYSWVLVLAVPVLAVLLVLLLVSPGFRWYFPGVGRLYRTYVCSQILQALAFLLQTGRPAPQALAVLAADGGFVGAARRRLHAVRRRVERGEPLADSLRRGRVLPRSMAPLLHSAERVGNVPWAMAELGDLLAARLARRAQRLGLLLFPVPVVGAGVLVGVIILGVFMPLITIINELAQ